MLVWAEGRGWVTRGLLKPQEPMIEGPSTATEAAAEAPA